MEIPNSINPLAFPSGEDSGPAGMRLLDYFAAAALTGIFAGELQKAIQNDAEIAEAAYNIALRMLKERERRMSS